MDWALVKVKGDMTASAAGLTGEHYAETEHFDWKKMCISGASDGLQLRVHHVNLIEILEQSFWDFLADNYLNVTLSWKEVKKCLANRGGFTYFVPVVTQCVRNEKMMTGLT